MSVSVKELEDKALQLDARERAELVRTLIASLEGEIQGDADEIAAAWDAEIERRVGEMEAGRMKFVDAGDALRSLRARAVQRRPA
jgi:putative addiction module component (TIGR02574 family)